MLGAKYPSKKVLKENVGKRLNYIETSFFGPEFKPDGINVVVGPDPYNNRKWFAEVYCKDGLIVKVK